jgi:DNA modification methylase
VNPVGYLETGVIYCDDNDRRLAEFPDECVDLIYLDPPFFSNKHYEVIWGDEAEVRSFEDRWEGGIQVYVNWMRERMIELHRVLRPTGSLYLHCDPNASHYLKVMCDGVFGQGRFRSEVIWKRSSAHSDMKQGRAQLGSIHDTILVYSKGDEWTWNPIFKPYDPAYVASKYRHVEPGTGRKYRLDNLTGPGGAGKGNPEYEVMGVTRHWRYSREKMDELIAEGRIVQTKPGTVPQYKRYLDEMPGVPLQDVWTDLDPINSRARERLGYPTQKPEALLERIIRLSSNPGQIVLDPFCGCGTTVAVSERLGRQWVGIDISPTAVNLMVRRVLKNTNGAVKPKVVGLPVTPSDLRQLKPFEFQNWVIQRLSGTHSPRKSGDMGIDGFSFMLHEPIQVKQSERVGRNVVDNFETAVERSGKDRGYIIAFSFTRGAYEETARAKAERGIDIRLVEISTLTEGPPDRATPDLLAIFKRLPTSPDDLPLLPPPPLNKRPTTRQLIASDQSVPLVPA